MNGLYLRSGELSALHDATQILLTPHEFSSSEEWRAASLRGVARVVGADLGMFITRGRNGETSITSDGLPRTDEYIPRVSGFDARLRLFNRQMQLITWSRASLWHRHLEEMRRSSYYQDYIRPIRGFDTIGLTVARGADGGIVSLHLNHDTERGTPFGDRGLALLRLLEPAFRTGVALGLNTEVACSPVGAREARGGPEVSRDAALRALFPTLTEREREVIRLLAVRRTNREVASALGLSQGTAKRHVENILSKMGLASRRDIEPLLDR